MTKKEIKLQIELLESGNGNGRNINQTVYDIYSVYGAENKIKLINRIYKVVKDSK